ncbi:MAG TPA: S9 family peptidase [Gaiellaceae bacterium]|jgi:dipeptidyl aminopeptidase/acylaminoacyl peptidase
MAIDERPRSSAGKLLLEQFLDLHRITEAVVSADGSRIAYSLSASCAEKGSRPASSIWTVDLQGNAEQATQGSGVDSTPRWSPSGTLAFASDRGHPGRMAVHVLPAGPGEAQPLGDVPGSVEDLSWSPDGSRLVVLAADMGSDRAGIQAATEISERGAGEDDPKVTRPFEAWRRLYLVDAETGETTVASPDGVNVFEFDWDGRNAVAICSDDPSESAWYSAYVARLDLQARTADRLYQPEWQIECVCLSGDGGRVWFVEGLCSDRGALAGDVKALDLGTCEVRDIRTVCDVSSLQRAGDRGVWFAGWRGMGTVCGRLSLGGDVEELWAGDATIGDRVGPRISVGGDVIAAVLDEPGGPPDLAVLDNGEWRRLTAVNPAAPDPDEVCTWEAWRWNAPDGLEIEGLLGRSRDLAGPLPLVVAVHGGPTGCWSHGWTPYGGTGTLLAQEGYAVFLPNPRGSAGRGQEFARANLGDMGGGDFEDILAGIESLVEAGIADSDRVGITGGSYGGFMAAWAVTQSDRFACSIPVAAVTDYRSFHHTTNIGRFDELFLDADPFEVGGEYDARSPVVHAKKCKTPTLLIHGEADRCVPVSQAQEMYQALVEAGCETELVVYPREGHGTIEREHIADVWSRARDWFARYLG